jgi:hypothetical protein
MFDELCGQESEYTMLGREILCGKSLGWLPEPVLRPARLRLMKRRKAQLCLRITSGAYTTAGRIFLTLALLFSPLTSDAETPSEKIRRTLVSEALFTEQDFETLKKGRMVEKLLPVADKREVAIIGVIAINAPLDLGLKTFQETMARQNKKSIIHLGNFSIEPQLDDIKLIELEDADIRALSKCKVGDCKIKLSAAMIERFQKEIDWASPSHPTQVNQLFRQILFEYVRDYHTRGNDALMEVRSEKVPLLLRDEYRSLFSNIV